MTKLQEALHSLFAFSASTRWIPCAGSMAYPANTADGGDAGEYADEGTAAHTLASDCLKTKVDAIEHLGRIIKVGKREFEVTEEFADHVQTYIDDVRRRSLGGYLMVEQRVSLDGVEGFDETNYGTSDAVIAIKNYGVVADLKFGQGERVYAWLAATATSLFKMEAYLTNEDDAGTTVEPNYQLMMYALACLRDISLLIDTPKGIMIVINQPRLGSMSELWVPLAVLERFALFAAEAYARAQLAMGMGVEACEKADAIMEKGGQKFFNPGEKQCRWCKAVACKARGAKVREEIGAEFDTIGDKPPKVPVNAPQLAKAMLAVPFIADWCNAVMSQAHNLVAAGTDIIGPDDKPYKFVEGKQGKRKWKNVKAAEAALLTNLDREKVYKEVLITAPAADKLFKKAARQTWDDVFKPLIGQAPGKPTLVPGSDPRPVFSPNAGADEFDVEEDDE